MTTEPTPMPKRVPKADALRLRRKLVIHMSTTEYENVRLAAACESISSFVRGVLRERVRVQG
jgi:hypothetical protein